MTPEGWRRSVVRDVFALGRGRVISKDEIAQAPGPYPVFSSQTTKGGEMGTIASYDFDGEYVTWTTDGANAGTVFYRNGRFNCTNVCGVLKALGDRNVDLRYAAFALGQTAKRHVTRVGNDKLMNNVFAEIPLLLPPLWEQKKIAAILTAVDEAIEATQAVIDQLQVVKSALMSELLTRGLPGRHSAFKETTIGPMPASWGLVTLGSVANVAYGLTVNAERRASSTLRPYLTVANVQDEGFELENVKSIGVLVGDGERYALRNGDVLVIEGNANPNRVGRALVWRNEVEGALHQNHLIRARVTSASVCSAWIVLALNSSGGRKQMLDSAKTSSGLHTINSKVVGNALLPLPSLSEQCEMLHILDAAEGRVAAERSTLKALRKCKGALADVLLSGTLRVPAQGTVHLGANAREPDPQQAVPGKGVA